MKATKNSVKAQWRPASQPRRVRATIQQLPDACPLAQDNDRTYRTGARALTECDAAFRRALPAL